MASVVPAQASLPEATAFRRSRAPDSHSPHSPSPLFFKNSQDYYPSDQKTFRSCIFPKIKKNMDAVAKLFSTNKPVNLVYIQKNLRNIKDK